MDLTEIRYEYVDWIHLAQDKDRWNLGSIKGGSFLDELSNCFVVNESNAERSCFVTMN